MEETVLFPSPNWFQTTGLSVSVDRWFVYGGPQKSLCVLEPIPDSLGIVKGDVYRAHVLHKAHLEKVVSVDISPEWPEKRAFISGSADGCVKCWVLEQADNKYKLKTTHSHSVHSNEKEEVVGVGYSNEPYAVTVGSLGHVVKWDLNSNVIKTYRNFLKIFRPSSMSCSPHVPLNVAIGTKQGVMFVVDLTGPGKVLYKVRGQDDEIVSVSWCPQFEVCVKQALDIEKKVSANERMHKIRQEAETSEQNLNNSGLSKTLPEDSFDESIVQEDDLFDMYKDYETDAFGPKKYDPEEILVKVKEVKPEVSYLDECKKLTEEILKRKNQPEASIESLVDALENVAVDKEADSSDDIKTDDGKDIKSTETVLHQHKHLVSSLGKNGCARIWANSGKLISSCLAPISTNKNQKNIKIHQCTTLLWCKPDMLLIADGRSQLLQCNPLEIDGKNKFLYKLVHSQHRRGLFSIVSDAPRVQTPESTEESKKWSVWTTAQDRNVIRYSLGAKEVVYTHATCGGFLYNVQSCPYDARKVAVSSGDGAVRVLELDVAEEETKLSVGGVATYWQNVQGKVLTVAWHPTKENLLAFGTAEARVGLIDANGKTDRPARALLPALSGGVYSLCWAERDQLLAAANGELVLYNTSKPDQPPVSIKVYVEGVQWAVSCVRARGAGVGAVLAVGSCEGGVVVTTAAPQCTELAANYLYIKAIYNVEWHPEHTSEGNEESPYKNLIAVSSLDKLHSISILEYGDKEDGSKQLQVWRVLTGHKNSVLQLAWSPHRDQLLASTSQDFTIRVWDVSAGACVCISRAHAQYAVCAAWSARPQLPASLLSGGADCSLRLWTYTDYPADKYQEEVGVTKKDKKKHKQESKKAEELNNEISDSLAVAQEEKVKTSKKFLLPLMQKQMVKSLLPGAKKMLENYIKKNTEQNKIEININTFNKEKSENSESEVSSPENAELDMEESDHREFDIDFIKIFGSTNDINEVFDLEFEEHLMCGNLESCVMLCMMRGRVHCAVQLAAHRDMLCPYLLSLTPCVSHKYWKEVMQLYIAQIDRLIARGEDDKQNLSRKYGGAVFRKLGALLSAHELRAAAALLAEHRLYREAYVLCRTRHMDSIAAEVLAKWAQHAAAAGNWPLAGLCHLAMGDLAQAANSMGKSNEPEFLCLAAEMAKLAGQSTFADHIEERKSNIMPKEKPVPEADSLAELPTRMELLLTNKEEERIKEIEQTDLPRMEQLLRDGSKKELNSTEVKTESLTEGDMEKLPSKMELLLKEYSTGSKDKENQSHVN